MKIGIFDSGLGGLVIAKAIFKRLPAYDYIYLGDTKNLPYGDKSPEQIFKFTKSALDYLFAQDCAVVLVACNTSSAWALRKIQQQYLPKNYPKRRVLGVIIPTLEEADKKHRHKKIGIIGTAATIKSHIYKVELEKLDPLAQIFELATPTLTPLIEANSLQKAKEILQLSMKTLQKNKIEVLILGCTHYSILKKEAKKFAGKKVDIISQDEIISTKLADYIKRHNEIKKGLSANHRRKFLVTKLTPEFKAVGKRLFGKNIALERIKI